MITRSSRLIAPLAWALTCGLAGCHLPSDKLTGNPERPRGNAGRALGDAGQATTRDFYPAVRATLLTLDELQVRPETLTLENGARPDRPLHSTDLAEAVSNAAILPPDQAATRDLFEHHRLPTNRPDTPYLPFDPVALDYRGKDSDGRPVAVVVRAPAAGQPGFEMSARVGPEGAGDEVWSRAFMDKVFAKIAAQGPGATTPAADPPLK